MFSFTFLPSYFPFSNYPFLKIIFHFPLLHNFKKNFLLIKYFSSLLILVFLILNCFYSSFTFEQSVIKHFFSMFLYLSLSSFFLNSFLIHNSFLLSLSLFLQLWELSTSIKFYPPSATTTPLTSLFANPKSSCHRNNVPDRHLLSWWLSFVYFLLPSCLASILNIIITFYSQNEWKQWHTLSLLLPFSLILPTTCILTIKKNVNSIYLHLDAQKHAWK